jgi:DNA-directed RNA polymerase subunit alpha
MAVTRIPIPEWDRRKKEDDRLDLSLAEVDLSVRTVNCLEDEGIFTVMQLLNCTPQRLLGITNFGERTLQQIYDALEKEGLYRREKRPLEQGNLRISSEEDHAQLEDADSPDT